MFQLIALVCVLDSSPRGHHCDPVVYPDRFETKIECTRFQKWLMFNQLPSHNKKMVMGDCMFKQENEGS